MPNHTIRIHEFENGSTGHTNIEYFIDGISQGAYGANLNPNDLVGREGLNGGVYREDFGNAQRIVSNPTGHSFSDISVSESAFNSSLDYVQQQNNLTLQGKGDYDLYGGNCVNLVDNALQEAGFARGSAANYLSDGSLLDIYANVHNYFTNNNFASLINASPIWKPAQYVIDWVKDKFNMGTGETFWPQDWIGALETAEKDLGQTCEIDPEMLDNLFEWSSPIAIDLNGDGVQTVSLFESGVQFDLDADGALEHTGWLSSEDAFVVTDHNDNGFIDNVSEMFGGAERGAGYMKLSAYDSNGDGWVDGSDDRFGELSLWRDNNGNGVTDEGELHSLEDFSVARLGVDYESSEEMNEGNLLGEISSAIVDGQATQMADVYFRTGGKPSQAPVTQGQDAEMASIVAALSHEMAAFNAEPTASTAASIFSYQGDLANVNVVDLEVAA